MSNLIQRHPYHLVDSSPWPFLAGISALTTTSGFVMYMHCYLLGFYLLVLGFVSLIIVSFLWWRDIIRESTFQGHHTRAVQSGLRLAMLLFILSEIMFFFAFFWAFFASSLSPSLDIGGVWPPPGINVLNPWEIPLLNTVILLLSGATCTWSHNSIVLGDRSSSLISLTATILLGVIFTILQGFEYVDASFSISDGIYGSVFFFSYRLSWFPRVIRFNFLVGVCCSSFKPSFYNTASLWF